MDYTGHDDTITNLQDRIRNAYHQLVTAPRAWVTLTDLRPMVGGHREFVDEALRRLSRGREALLVPQANQKILTGADRDAALWLGNQQQHLIAMD